MELLSKLLEGIMPLIPTVGLVAVLLVALMALHRVLETRAAAARRRFGNQILMLVLSLLGLLVVILTLPVSDAFRGQLLSLSGILLSAMLALSSTTLLGNAMAGVMLRAVRSFRSGDFIRVGDHYGRVSERGLFHTEIQTEEGIAQGHRGCRRETGAGARHRAAQEAASGSRRDGQGQGSHAGIDRNQTVDCTLSLTITG